MTRSLLGRLTIGIGLLTMAMLSLIPAAGAAASTAIYVRPNEDISHDIWTIVGSSSLWDALDDNVTEAETPGNGDYINNTTTNGHARVRLGTTSLAGVKVLSSSVWFYTPTTTTMKLTVKTVKDGKTGGSTLASGSFSGAGWHSLSITLNGTQSQLDEVYLEFHPGLGAGTRQVYAAFLKLTVELPEPTVYWGAWMDGDVYGGELTDAPWDSQTWDLFEEHSQKPVSIVHFGQPPPWRQEFSATPLELTRARGAIPLMDMGSEMDFVNEKKENVNVSLSDISKGTYDSYLGSWAKAVKSYGQPFFFRWNWEMNGSWFQWGEEASKSPTQYVTAWKHLHDIAESQGATNITWVWCPNTKFTGSTSLASLYPGSSYVDWTCIDGYNFGGGEWTSFSKLFSPTYSELLEIAPSKPIMIGETASAETGGSKSEWITDMLATQIPTNFPAIKAVNWFNWNIVEGGVERPWPIETSNAAQLAFSNMVASPYYAENNFGGLPALSRIEPLP